MGVDVVGMPGEPAVGVMSDDEIGPELPDMRDEFPYDGVERRVAEARAAGRRLRHARIGVPQHPWLPGAEDAQRIRQLTGTVGVFAPGRGDHGGACTGGGVLGEDATGGEDSSSGWARTARRLGRGTAAPTVT